MSFSARDVRQLVIRNALLVGLVGMGGYFATQSSTFLTGPNLRNILLANAVMSIVAITMALLLLAGHVDLSVGSTLGLGGVVAGLMLTNGVDPILAALGGTAVGAAVGAFNGGLSALVGFSPIIVTLGTLTGVRGLTFLISEQPVFGFSDGFLEMGRGYLVGIPILVVIAGVVFLAAGIFLNFTPRGRHVFAIGVNPEAAYLSGVSVRILPFALYVVTGAAAGFGGVLLISRLNSAPPGTLGVGLEFTVLTAVLLGGVAFGGGRGSVLGVLFGVLFLGVLQNGLTLMNVSPFTQMVVQGSALVVAAALDYASTRFIGSIGGRGRELQEASIQAKEAVMRPKVDEL